MKKIRWFERLQGGKHLALLVSFLLLFIVVPFVNSTRFGAVVTALLGTIVLLSGLYALSAKKHLMRVVSIVALAVIIVDAILVVSPSDAIETVSDALTLLLFGVFAVVILTDVLRPGRISSDKIYGAICVYLSLGFLWMYIYSLLASGNPGAFNGLSSETPTNHVARLLDLRYYSFITLATVGYGDIVPRSVAARTFATLEAIVGQFYIAILVARLVGLHIMHSTSAKE